ncbi:deoxyribonuclease IV [Glycomyces sp. NPDC048151]|uniref:deoxyribonuclease IV n=1 Tax=Glycomyces sp. NPDC048151 TaxID=3364002 RepID=UPI0037196158
MGSVKGATGHKVGAHVPVGGGLVKKGLVNAEEYKVETLQVFLGSPRGWAPPSVNPVDARRFRDECAERDWPVFVHASYLLNLASPDKDAVQKSVEHLRLSLAAAGQIGAQGVVVHAGSSRDGDRPAALKRLKKVFKEALKGAPKSVRLLVEPTAGGANAMAWTFETTGEYIDAVGIAEVGLCFDTCHLHAAGEDLADRDGLEASLEALNARIGSGRIGLIHYNDSKDPRDSRRDRHEMLGKGILGDKGLRAVAASPALAGVPLVVETPTQAEDVAHAKKLVKQAAKL